MKIEEQVSWGGASNIDEDAGVIRGVKILGLVSSNGRKYKEEALIGAKGLYEGMGVNLDHREDGERKVSDGFGRTVNVAMREDGLYGDLEYLKSHPYSNQLVEAAKRMPEQLGLSHSAFGEVNKDGEEEYVEAIHKVRSVDLVRYPASTKGLFESQQELSEVKDSARSHFRAAILSIMDDSSLSKEEIGRKIMTILKAEDKVLGSKDAEELQPSTESEQTEDKQDEVTEETTEDASTEEEVKEDDQSDLTDRLAKLEERQAELQHDLDLSECIRKHKLDLDQISTDQMNELRSKKDRKEMDQFAESLPKVVKGEKPVMPRQSSDNFDAIREEMVSVYGFRK